MYSSSLFTRSRSLPLRRKTLKIDDDTASESEIFFNFLVNEHLNFFSSFRQRKLGLGFSVICKFVQLLKLFSYKKKLLKLHHCSKKTNQSKPPNTIAKSNLLVPYEDASSEGSFFHAESDLGDDDDDDEEDPQLCGAFACEAKKRPAIDYMERFQANINSTMHAILIDWLVEVAEAFSLSPETLYLAVNCLDRYLSGNVITELNLQLLGVSCIMISAKYYGRGSVRAPPRQVESFCYITDYTYSSNELLEMESCVLNYLKFELTTPTANCFLSRFVPQGKREEEVLSHLLFESLASYLCVLSLLDYAMLRYAPSLVAASAVFLARYVLHPSRKPSWSSTLEHYTRYRAEHLEACVKNLLRLCHESPSGDNVVAVRKKYSKAKYKFAANMIYPTSLPQELFL
ncbi:cyclin-A1-2-like [Brassica napus]|uniref:cyclin-A1-2-like n=1 Tax=Brassica napus TaxID=3708 RepID=UPI00207A0A56|nr:cyclin-A1-2-like [Brassica napus]